MTVVMMGSQKPNLTSFRTRHQGGGCLILEDASRGPDERRTLGGSSPIRTRARVDGALYFTRASKRYQHCRRGPSWLRLRNFFERVIWDAKGISRNKDGS